jgi:hypothetical protein
LHARLDLGILLAGLRFLRRKVASSNPEPLGAVNMTRASNPDYRWIFVAQLYVAFVVWGAGQVLSQNSAVYELFTLLTASSATTWVYFDARYRRQPLPHIVLFIHFLIWPVALPLYLLSTRRIQGLGWAALHCVGLQLALDLSFRLAWWGVYG